MKTTKHASLGEIAIELGINKSKLAYYFSRNLITPIATIGRMNVFEHGKTLKIVQKIENLKKQGKTLDQIRKMI